MAQLSVFWMLIVLHCLAKQVHCQINSTQVSAVNAIISIWPSLKQTPSTDAYCNWTWITCDNLNIIVNLTLNNPGPVSGLPSQIGYLTALKTLSIVAAFSGYIPTEFGQLTSLTSLRLSQNGLSQIPSQIGKLNLLEVVVLSNNSISRQIPSQLGKLLSLTELNLQQNNLNGQIPLQLGNLKNLKTLDLSDNSGLTGSFPGFGTNLTSFSANNLPNITGCFPTTNAILDACNVHNTPFNCCGSVPASCHDLACPIICNASESGYCQPLFNVIFPKVVSCTADYAALLVIAKGYANQTSRLINHVCIEIVTSSKKREARSNMLIGEFSAYPASTTSISTPTTRTTPISKDNLASLVNNELAINISTNEVIKIQNCGMMFQSASMIIGWFCFLFCNYALFV